MNKDHNKTKEQLINELECANGLLSWKYQKPSATLIPDVEEVSYIGLWPEAEKITA